MDVLRVSSHHIYQMPMPKTEGKHAGESKRAKKIYERGIPSSARTIP
jgi:hypothetical protein